MAKSAIMQRISTEELQSDFDHYLALAKSEAVLIMENRKDDLVLLSYEQYQHLTQNENKQ